MPAPVRICPGDSFDGTPSSLALSSVLVQDLSSTKFADLIKPMNIIAGSEDNISQTATGIETKTITESLLYIPSMFADLTNPGIILTQSAHSVIESR
jgi:hypothetical protein